jgi:hypothetical protein
MFPVFRKRKTELTENGNFSFFAENGNGELSRVCCKRKRKPEVFVSLIGTINSNRRLL